MNAYYGSLNRYFSLYYYKAYNTVKTVTLGGFNLKLIFDDRKLKILVFTSFSPHRYNLPIVKGSFCRYASGLVALQSTCRCRRFTVGFTAGNQFTVSLRQIQRIKYNIVLPWFYSEA